MIIFILSYTYTELQLGIKNISAKFACMMQLQSHNQNKVTLLEAPDSHLPRQDCSVSTRFTSAHVPHTLTQRHHLREDVHVDHKT